QLQTLFSALYQHPHGKVPAYEWNFSDTNPPVHAWAVWQVYLLDSLLGGKSDIDFLASMFRSLWMSLTEWLNTEDPAGNDIFGGAFLGMDNIGVFNRDEPLPDGGFLGEVDGTAWVAEMVLQMIQIADELSRTRIGYRTDIAKLILDFSVLANIMEVGVDGV